MMAIVEVVTDVAVLLAVLSFVCCLLWVTTELIRWWR